MKKYLVLLLITSLVIPVLVLAEPPKCILKADPVSGSAPLTVKVSEVSRDKTIVDWGYNFGDGTSIHHSAVGEHTYSKTGEFVLVLTVVNDKGEEATDTTTITVSPGAETTPTPTPTATPTPKPTMNETTTVKVVYEGTRSISDAITASAATKDTAVVLKEETEKVMSAVSFPYNVTKEETKTTFRIVKYRWDEKMQVCGYWIEATRDGKEVYTNSPIWISPPPYQVTVSEVYDEKTNEVTTTIKEDPKLAVEQILQQYVDNQPLGKPIVGTKE
ncbi:MAG: PKD domain-containing protein [Methanoregula sp.]|jgi:PKD repeat protein|nr:PKD domain-containing protein [Methanoregula sp.]